MTCFRAFVALALSILGAHGDGPELAWAIARVVVLEHGHEAPVYTSHAHDAALMAWVATQESGARLDAVNPWGRSFGAWQQDASVAKGTPAIVQARAWYAHLRRGKRLCPNHPLAIMWGQCHSRSVLTGGDTEDLAIGREDAALRILQARIARQLLIP